jgi:hypothetical protein
MEGVQHDQNHAKRCSITILGGRGNEVRIAVRCISARGVDLEHFGVGNHEGAVPRKVALVKLAEASPGHLRLVPPIHFGDVVPLDAGDAVQPSGQMQGCR